MSRYPAADRTAPTWDPVQYGAFGDHRSRPFSELLARVDITEPSTITDLGCGTGELTATLARRWPRATIEALDRSPEMIEAAQAHAMPGRLTFKLGDAATWHPDGPADLIVANAVLHWIPGHTELLPHWAGALTPGGRLAFQVPGNHDAPSHTLLRDLCRTPRWRHLEALLPRHTVLDPQGYHDILTGHGCAVDAWETTYIQVLHGDDPVLEWVKGTTLRPILTALDDSEAQDFLAEYGTLLRDAYPPSPNGTVFPFRRVFIVATAPARTQKPPASKPESRANR